MASRSFLMLAALAACGAPKQQRLPVDNPTPTGSASQLQPVDAAVAVVIPDAAPPAGKPWSRDELPKWEPVAQDKSARASEPMTVWAVDTDGDWLLREVSPKWINYVYASTGKRLTGQLHAPAKFDAFATIAGVLGVKVESIKPKGKGDMIVFDFIGAPFPDLVRVLADVGRVNVVIAPGTIPTLNVRLKSIPWEQALQLMISRAGLTYVREGNAYFVVPKGTKLAPTPKLAGASMDVDANDATVAQIVTGVRALGKLELGSCATAKVSVRLKRVAPGTIVKALEVAGGEKLADKAACPSKQLADEPIADLKLVAIVSQGVNRVAVFDHKGATVIGTKYTKRLRDIGSGYVTFTVDSEEVSLQLHPYTDRSKDDLVKSFMRTSALIQRGEYWTGILETTNGPRSVSSKWPVTDEIGFAVKDDGVHVIRDDTEIRVLPLAPK